MVGWISTTVSHVFHIDSSVSKARFQVGWSGSHLDMTLRSPSGAVIDPAVAAADPNIEYQSGDTYAYYDIASPQAGAWEMNVMATDVPPGGEEYRATVTAEAQVTMRTYFDRKEYSLGQPITMTAVISDNIAPIRGATVTATVAPPGVRASASRRDRSNWITVNGGDAMPPSHQRDGKASSSKSFASTVEMTLYDDGAHNDGGAHDGVYSNVFTATTVPGSYTFNIHAAGKTNTGEQFTREEQSATYVTTAGVSMNISTAPNAWDIGELELGNSTSTRITVSSDRNYESNLSVVATELRDSQGNVIPVESVSIVVRPDEPVAAPGVETNHHSREATAARGVSTASLILPPQGSQEIEVTVTMPSEGPIALGTTYTGSIVLSDYLGSVTVPITVRTTVTQPAIMSSPGLKMITLPFDFKEVDHGKVLPPGDSLRLARYEIDPLTSIGTYQLYSYPNLNPALSSFGVGRGFWIKLAEGESRTIQSPAILRATDDSRRIPLAKRWNCIGTPSLQAWNWSLSSIKVSDGSSEVSLSQAQSSGIMEDFAWGWNPTTQSYELVYDATDPFIGALVPRTTLDPWEGYWVYAYRECQLILPPPTSGKMVAKQPQIVRERPLPSETNWELGLTAKVGDKSDTFNYLGVREKLGKINAKLSVTSPPVMSPYVDLYFVSESPSRSGDTRKLAIDFRKPQRNLMRWDFVVEGDVPDQEVVLSWPDMTRVPKNYRFTLIEEETGRRQYMRTTSQVSFRAGAKGFQRRFAIEVDPTGGQRLCIQNLRVTGERLSRRISFLLSADAEVRAVIRTATGRVVASVSPATLLHKGINFLNWDGKGNKGEVLPRGIYLIEIVATTDEGQRVKAVCTFRN